MFRRINQGQHPKRWASVLLEDRNRLPRESGVYAVVKRGKIYYIGVSGNLNQRWAGKGHHRFSQADGLGKPRLHYLLLPGQQAKSFEKMLIAKYSPLWNYSKVPAGPRVPWWQRGLMVATGLLVMFIGSRSLVLGALAMVVAIALFR